MDELVVALAGWACTGLYAFLGLGWQAVLLGLVSVGLTGHWLRGRRGR